MAITDERGAPSNLVAGELSRSTRCHDYLQGRGEPFMPGSAGVPPWVGCPHFAPPTRGCYAEYES